MKDWKPRGIKTSHFDDAESLTFGMLPKEFDVQQAMCECSGEQVVNKPPKIVKETNPKDIVGTRKAPMSTVSGPVMAEVGVAMLEGACKYGRHNYRAVGVRASVYYDATQRHLISWWEGEDLDPDSELSHITKAITSLVVLRDAMINNKVTDDRPPSCGDFYTELNKKAAAIIDKYEDKNPRHYTVRDLL